MARQIISFGSGPGTQTGDTAYVGGQKINSNFEELYTMVDVLTRIDIIDTAKGFSISGTNVTVNADWIWIINNSQYTNPDAVVLAVNLSSTGKIRKVYVVPNSSNGFNLVEGDEVDDSVTDPPTPELPYGGMYVTYFNVTDSVIGVPAATNNGDSLTNKLDKGSFYGTADDLVDKNSYSWTNVNTLSGVIVDYVNPFTGMSINFKDAVTELHSLSFPTVAKRPYFGALGFIKNSQTIDILIPHKELSLVANRYCFAFPNEQDLVLKPNEILFFKADPDETHSYGYLDAIGVGFNDNDLVHKTGDETIDGNKSFLQPVSGVTATADEHLVPKAQMDSAISTETTRATTAETTLQTNIDAEETARIAADADVLQEAKDYTDTGLALKLDASAYNDRYKGKYTSLANLEAAHPTSNAGDYAQVDAGAGSDVVNYNWDTEEGWVEGGSGSAATNTDALPEGSTNLYFTTARVLATVLTGISFVTGGAIVSTDSILVAFGKLQKQINDLLTAVSLKQDALVSGTNIKTINGSSILGSGDLTVGSSETATSIGALIGSAADATPNDSDYVATAVTGGGILKKITWTNVKAFLKTYFDGLYAPKSPTIIETGSSFSLNDTYNQKIVILTASCTVTLPNGLAAGFGITIVTLAGVTLTLVKGGSVTLFNNAGLTMDEKLSCTIQNRTATNQYITAGNL